MLFIFFGTTIYAQFGSLQGGRLGNIGDRISGFGSAFQGGLSSGNGADSLEERDFEAERIRVRYRALFDQKYMALNDSSFNPRREQFFIPYGKNPLGNYGNVFYSYVWSEDLVMQPGPNFHLTPYRFYQINKEDIKVYDAIKPFASLGYLIGSKQQQILSGSYTQNITKGMNVFFDYQFINSPGYFKNQNANSSQLSFGFHYHTYEQRYMITAFFIRNNVVSNENGGVISDTLITGTSVDAYLADRTTVPVNLGDNVGYTTNPFNLTLNKGRHEKNLFLHIENTYRLGVHDSAISADSSLKLFLLKPRWTISHILEYENLQHIFMDISPFTDVFYYQNFYPSISEDKIQSDTFLIRDKWNIYRNTAQLRYYPQLGNINTFWEGALMYEYMQDSFFFNTSLPRANQFNLSIKGQLNTFLRRWNTHLNASANYYFQGVNQNDLKLDLLLRKELSHRWGILSMEAFLMRATPFSFFKNLSAFNLYSMKSDKYLALNLWHLQWNWDIPRWNLSLLFKWNKIKNWVWYPTRDHNEQYTGFIDIPTIEVSKLFHIIRGLYFFTRSTLQISLDNLRFSLHRSFSRVLQLPLFHTYNQLYYEHNFFGYFRVVGGIEVRWNTPFQAPYFSPLYASFVYQDKQLIYNRPQIHCFLKVRIRNKFSFNFRAENLNALTIANGILRNTKNNFILPNYPLYPLIFQGGVVWDFVN